VTDRPRHKPNNAELIVAWLMENPGWHISWAIVSGIGWHTEASPALIRAHLSNLGKAHKILKRVKHAKYKGGIGGYTGPVYEYRRVVNMDV
jgi:hypothetical protein